MTVAELIKRLQALPPALEVYSAEAYDNDTEWVKARGPRVTLLNHCEAYFYTEVDPADVASNPDLYPQAHRAVVVE